MKVVLVISIFSVEALYSKSSNASKSEVQNLFELVAGCSSPAQDKFLPSFTVNFVFGQHLGRLKATVLSIFSESILFGQRQISNLGFQEVPMHR